MMQVLHRQTDRNWPRVAFKGQMVRGWVRVMIIFSQAASLLNLRRPIWLWEAPSENLFVHSKFCDGLSE